MSISQSVPELVAAARADAKVSEDRISEVRLGMAERNGSEAQVENLRAASRALELAAIDIFTLFESRMQHHFKRGPFSRKLKVLLLKAGQAELADRLHQYYLAINVLKHGKGASYRELLNTPRSFVVVRPNAEIIADDALIDISAPGFFDGLTTTILEAYHFLEGRVSR